MVQQRDTVKAKRPVGRPASGARALPAKARPAPAEARPARDTDVAMLSARIAELERELAQAQQRLSEFEALRAQAINRIDWAIDSLHNVLDVEG